MALTIIFTLIGVPLGLLFGFMIGMASMLPFMGAIAQTSVNLFLMLQDFNTGLLVFVIALVLGQIVDNVIVPRVMGGTGRGEPHLVAGSRVYGGKTGRQVGILLAVPVSSVLKSIADDWWEEQHSHAMGTEQPEL